MRVRKLDANGDFAFGQGSANYWANAPEGVGQSIATRLKLIKGEWFLDVTAGTDWNGKILGRKSQASYDGEIKRVIMGTIGVASLLSYSSNLFGRHLTITASVQTIYSTTPVTITQTLAIRA